MAWVNGALVKKKLEAIRSHSTKRSCMVLAPSCICVLERSLVVLSSGGSVWVGVLSVGMSLVRSMCTRTVADSAFPRISPAH
jgi:hypothetical protein